MRAMPGLVAIARAARPELAWPEALEVELAEHVATARAGYPTVHVPVATFVTAIATRVVAVDVIGRLAHADLWLACACAAGDAAGLAAFEARCGAVVARAVAASGATPEERDDLAQVIRQRLLVAPAAGGPPRIATYSARGSLVSWVRVVATREALRMLPSARRERGASDEELAGFVAGDDDPEIGYLKRLYRHEFKLAFAAAMDQLDDASRLLLRQHVLDDLGIDELAALHGVHRATAARHLVSARAELQRATQAELVARLRISRAELPSLVRLIESQLDVSLARLLQR